MTLHVKICGLRRQEDVDCAVSLGADMCGFIFAAGSQRCILPEEAAKLNSRGCTRVGVVVDADPEKLLGLMCKARLDILQLHGDQPEACVRAMRLPAGRIIRVLWPARYADKVQLEAAMRHYAPTAGMFLLDAGTSWGGSGSRIALESLAGLHSPRPWLLAGGLGPDTVAEAVAACHDVAFYGVDLNSGLESAPGCKDHQRMAAAMRAIGKLPGATVAQPCAAGTFCPYNKAEKEAR